MRSINTQVLMSVPSAFCTYPYRHNTDLSPRQSRRLRLSRSTSSKISSKVSLRQAQGGRGGFRLFCGLGACSSRLWRASVLLKHFCYRSLSSRPAHFHIPTQRGSSLWMQSGEGLRLREPLQTGVARTAPCIRRFSSILSLRRKSKGSKQYPPRRFL